MAPTPANATSWPARLLPDRYRSLLVAVFFGWLLVAGWRLAADYGSFIDEDSCRESRQVSLTYLYECVPPRWLPARAAARLAAIPARAQLVNYVDRDHGVAFELPLAIVEKLTGYSAMRDILLLRHRAVFLVCWGGCLAFYWLITQRLRSWRAGLLGVALLLMSPRVAADFFYNAKDAVFLAYYLVGTCTAIAFVQRPRWQSAAAHALAYAVAIDVRVTGIILPVLTLGLLAVRAGRGDYVGQRAGPATLLFGALLPLLVVAGWPYLWAAPGPHLWESLLRMSHFRWTGVILHQGVLLPEGAVLPWSYAPVWIIITTPLLVLAGLVVSLMQLVRQLARRRWQLYATEGEWQDLLLWGLALGPLAAVAVLHSVLYDGWRQLYFVYPPLLALALAGLGAAWRWQPPGGRRMRTWWQAGVALVVSVSSVDVGQQMAQLHPLENLYFNTLAGHHPERRYEYDYWGLSLRQGMAWIVKHDARPLIRVRTNLPTNGIMDHYLVDPAQQHRLRIVRGAEPADYFISTYRDHPQPYPYGWPVHSLRVGPEGRRVHDIFRFTAP